MGFTAAQLGARLGVRESTVLRWETSASSPTPRHLALLAELLELDPGDLMPQLIRRQPTLGDLRALAALDLTTVAERTGLSRSSIMRIERGVTSIGDRTDSFAAAYGVDVDVVQEAAEHTRALLKEPPKKGKLHPQ